MHQVPTGVLPPQVRLSTCANRGLHQKRSHDKLLFHMMRHRQNFFRVAMQVPESSFAAL
jgi:hypothetical protein